MLARSVERILETLDDEALVLDIGGWAKPFPRADWVLDYMPYETRGLLGRDGTGEERFRKETWVQRDVCDREPYPFADDELDFVVCSQTLEDLRDPVWVCAEMVRIGKAGYVEVPSRLLEQSYGVEGPWAGYAHHRWLFDLDPDRLSFAFKSHVLHRRRSCHFPYGFHHQLRPEERALSLWWEGGFDFSERLFYDPAELDRYLEEFVERNKRGRRVPSRWQGVLRLVLERAGLRRWR